MLLSFGLFTFSIPFLSIFHCFWLTFVIIPCFTFVLCFVNLNPEFVVDDIPSNSIIFKVFKQVVLQFYRNNVEYFIMDYVLFLYFVCYIYILEFTSILGIFFVFKQENKQWG